MSFIVTSRKFFKEVVNGPTFSSTEDPPLFVGRIDAPFTAEDHG